MQKQKRVFNDDNKKRDFNDDNKKETLMTTTKI